MQIKQTTHIRLEMQANRVRDKVTKDEGLCRAPGSDLC